ncbi:MAG TPA: hypothetical protein VKA59_23455, partial [Vicinamibacterales bacterium]|nr:hypothetical protein [Vicinamibacterales bacterium]
DTAGRYEFNGVPAAKYKVRVDLPAREHAWGPGAVTLADPRGCAAADFYVVPDGRISLRVVDAQQRPTRDAMIELIELDAVKPGAPLYSTSHIRTDSSGRIEWPQLRPRRYAIAVNALSPPSVRQPYPTAFYPGVSTLAEAKPIQLGLGERVDLGEMDAPGDVGRTPRDQAGYLA